MDVENDTISSLEQSSKVFYRHDMTAIFIKTIQQGSVTDKVNVELKQNYLDFQHSEQDKQIAEAQKQTEKLGKEMGECDKKLYYASECRKQVLESFERAGEKVVSLKNEVGKISQISQDVKFKQEAIESRVKCAKAENTKLLKYKQQIKDLENNFQTLLNWSEPQGNQQLAIRSQELKSRYHLKADVLKSTRARKFHINNVNKQTFKSFREIHDTHLRNCAASENVDTKKKLLKTKEDALQETLSTMQDIESRKVFHLNQLRGELKSLLEDNEGVTRELGEMKGRVSEKDIQFQMFKEKVEDAKKSIEKESLKWKVEIESEIEQLKFLKEREQQILNKNNNCVKAIIETSDLLHTNKDKKVQILRKLFDKKTQLIAEQYKISDQQHKTADADQKRVALKIQLEEHRKVNESLAKSLEEMTMQQEKLSLEFEVKRSKIEQASTMEVEELQKQIQYQNALIEFQQVRLNEKTVKIQDYEREIEEFEFELRSYKLRWKSTKKRFDSIKKLTQKPSTVETNGSEEKSLKQNIDMQVTPVAMQTNVEDTEIEEKNQSILKSQLSAKPQQQTTPKRVTFHGVPSTDSSSLEGQNMSNTRQKTCMKYSTC